MIFSVCNSFELEKKKSFSDGSQWASPNHSMVSSPATYGTLPPRLPLTLENLQTLPKNARFVDAFVSEQRRNARFYAAEEVLFSVERPLVKTSKEVKKKQESNLLPPSPLLKSRLEMGHVTSVDADGPSSIPNPKELFKSFTHAREGEVLRKGSQKTSGRTKRARSPSDDEERSAREFVRVYIHISTILNSVSRSQSAS